MQDTMGFILGNYLNYHYHIYLTVVNETYKNTNGDWRFSTH